MGKIVSRDTTGCTHHRRIGMTYTGFKGLIDTETGSIVGTHIPGPSAGEVINVSALAIRLGIKRIGLVRAAWTYPSEPTI